MDQPNRMFRLEPFKPKGANDPKRLRAWLKNSSTALIVRHERDLADDPKMDHPDLPAGYTYFGQFLAHDLTFLTQIEPPIQHRNLRAPRGPEWSNARSPRADLDSVYGGGPRLSPELYGRYDADKLLIGGVKPLTLDSVVGAKTPREFVGDDLQRTFEGRAVIPDARNDETVMVSQMHLALQKAHNALVDALRERKFKGNVFEEARRLVRWHYQWLIVNDFLPRVLNAEAQKTLVARVKAKKIGKPIDAKRFRPGKEPQVPLEFSLGAFRFGHSLVRDRYVLNDKLPPIATLPNHWNAPGHTHLHMFRALPKNWAIDWRLFLAPAAPERYAHLKSLHAKIAENPRMTPQRARKIDPEITNRMAHLPPRNAAEPETGVLPFLTLERGLAAELPSGQAIAKEIKATKIVKGPDLPLWTYVLTEARDVEGGARLGEVGSLIVMEVIAGLVDADPESYLAREPKWVPCLVKQGETFDLYDLLMLGTMPELANKLATNCGSDLKVTGGAATEGNPASNLLPPKRGVGTAPLLTDRKRKK